MLPRPRKRFGQHFLTDRHYLGRIVEVIAPAPEDEMVEIGPGTGLLTAQIAPGVRHLHVVEIDRDLAAALRNRFPPQQVSVHEGDALEFDFEALPAPLRVVGNLPYNVSTPILFRIAALEERVRDCTFLLQKEVVDRMAARPGTPDYGRLSVMLQYRFAIAPLLAVPPGAFTPPPKVWSTVVRLLPHAAPPFPVPDPARFAGLVAHLFSMRRKTLGRSLKGRLTPEAIASLGIDPMARPETLAPADFARLAALEP